ncbi:hypothetical protein E1A91_D10G202300v1 [Gossypium mustelinum]|uniref:Phospholipid/glycerol acyltransferase domain-containing protein n=1 Tax=Gossypium mustelinum TaxID=34275 RepID=A0A5D2TBK0_GOSMU|nr:hypothetical protein E1A91_D10G202300v1 [Gossypium mustelinum]
MLFIFKITEGHIRSLFLKLKKSLLLTSVYYVLCRNSYVGNVSLFYEIEEKLKQGYNVVLISNHQTEADPIIISLLLEKANPHIAENMLPGWYIAWLLLKMEHYFIGFPQILILDANR